ncbi:MULTISPECIES: hypothetical protein [unclassified Undibacterium]|uniref:hypothetical protein n=1 Tax=unclassified Undibacterium TaxID=2630295 RepID=UPI002AC933CF|nr:MULTISPECIES: hypothetical protein [unclassified Undibacterium]MEB0171795.1 hypothetical protein [Undibacterium sp. CCC1.1]MEB0216719.1 hypothetical protein [Undibacterium sp. 5I2]MEB0140537.1 hypothetical protein [Undibacterium sp. CCC2.1]MEB0175611.1 hypothetical protein [Undibacterium sp. CCC3.4]WPX44086.1 hypothetical protein RHM61_02330 [Undibacterium sp. CCC3.4]
MATLTDKKIGAAGDADDLRQNLAAVMCTSKIFQRIQGQIGIQLSDDKNKHKLRQVHSVTNKIPFRKSIKSAMHTLLQAINSIPDYETTSPLKSPCVSC